MIWKLAIETISKTVVWFPWARGCKLVVLTDSTLSICSVHKEHNALYAGDVHYSPVRSTICTVWKVTASR